MTLTSKGRHIEGYVSFSRRTHLVTGFRSIHRRQTSPAHIARRMMRGPMPASCGRAFAVRSETCVTRTLRGSATISRFSLNQARSF